MKKSIWIIILLLGFSAFGQKIEKYSPDEINRIGTNGSEKMYVFQKVNTADSVVLKSDSKEVDAKHKLTQILAERMLRSVQFEGGVGIAAPQVGINRRMFWVQRFDKENNPFELFINPIIIWQSELMQKGPEGDLSFEERGFVLRHYAIQVEYETLEGVKKSENIEGFTSVIFQHERDHLDGILLVDRIDEQKNWNIEPVTGHMDLYLIKN